LIDLPSLSSATVDAARARAVKMAALQTAAPCPSPPPLRVQHGLG
jgi:hypothetical protein